MFNGVNSVNASLMPLNDSVPNVHLLRSLMHGLV